MTTFSFFFLLETSKDISISSLNTTTTTTKTLPPPAPSPVGYGRPDVTEMDIKTGVSAETEIAKDFELPQLLAQWATFGFDAQTLCILSGAHSFGLSGTSSPQGLLTTPIFSRKYYSQILSNVGFFTSDKTLSGPETLACVEKCSASQDYFFSQWRNHYFEMASWGVDQGVLKGIPVGTTGRR